MPDFWIMWWIIWAPMWILAACWGGYCADKYYPKGAMQTFLGSIFIASIGVMIQWFTIGLN